MTKLFLLKSMVARKLKSESARFMSSLRSKPYWYLIYSEYTQSILVFQIPYQATTHTDLFPLRLKLFDIPLCGFLLLKTSFDFSRSMVKM